MQHNNLFTLTDDEILRAAAEIVSTRQCEAAHKQTTEVQRLYNKYLCGRPAPAHDLGKPQRLTQEEALLLFALERNKYVVEGDCPNERHGGRWHGSAFCKFNVREAAMTMLAESRHDMLLSLWAVVSGQDKCERGVVLTEEHLEGSLVRAQMRDMWREIKEQERFDVLISNFMGVLEVRANQLERKERTI